MPKRFSKKKKLPQFVHNQLVKWKARKWWRRGRILTIVKADELPQRMLGGSIRYRSTKPRNEHSYLVLVRGDLWRKPQIYWPPLWSLIKDGESGDA